MKSIVLITAGLVCLGAATPPPMANPLQGPGDCRCTRTQTANNVNWTWTPSFPDTGRNGACDEDYCQTPEVKCEWDGVLELTGSPAGCVITTPGGDPGIPVAPGKGQKLIIDLDLECNTPGLYTMTYTGGGAVHFTFQCGDCTRVAE